MDVVHPDEPGTGAPAPALRPATREAALAMGPEEFRRLGHALVDSVATFLDLLPKRRVATGESPGAIRALLDAERPLPAAGTDAADLLRSATELLFNHSLFNGHPRFFGYITSSPAPIGILGDFLAAAVNANVGAWRLAPVATEIEAQAVRWIAELIGTLANVAACSSAAATWRISSACSPRERRRPSGTSAAPGLRLRRHDCVSMRRLRPIPGYRRRRISLASEPMQSAGFQRMRTCASTLARFGRHSRRIAAQESGR